MCNKDTLKWSVTVYFLTLLPSCFNLNPNYILWGLFLKQEKSVQIGKKIN